MSKEAYVLRRSAVFGLTLLIVASAVYALVPVWDTTIKYTNPDCNNVLFYTLPKELYVKDTLPNEWIAGWTAEALKAGAVIIRSGVYWRVNRTNLGSTVPNNNCYEGLGWQCDWWGCLYFPYDTTAPRPGGLENFIPNSNQKPENASTNAAVDATFQYHAETLNLISGRPDKLIMLRYGATIQNRTNQTTGSWLDRIWYAYTGPGHPGSPVNPNANCSQTDTWTPTSNPTFPNN